MTTIAYRNGEMAADSSCWTGGTCAHPAKKIWRVGRGLVGCAGDMGAMLKFVEWLRDGAIAEEFPAGEFDAITVDPEGRVRTWEGRLEALDVPKSAYYAIGSGAVLALGAMAVGATSKQAVQAAVKHDAHSAGPVRVYRLRRA